MKVEDLYKMSKEVTKTIGDKTNVDVTLYLNDAKHENLQQEVFKMYNKTLQGYKSKSLFEIIILNIKFIIKYKELPRT
jgi:glutamate formiminotransferase